MSKVLTKKPILSPAAQLEVDTSLFNAIFQQNLEEVNKFLAAGADINKKRMDGETPLHEAALNSSPTIAMALIEAGADINAASNTNSHY